MSATKSLGWRAAAPALPTSSSSSNPNWFSSSGGGGGGNSDGDVPADAALYEVLVDEVRHVEGERDAALRREAHFARAVEALAGYVTVVEQSVIVPAMGDLLAAIARFHDVAAARAHGVGAVDALEREGVVTPQSHPQAARAFAALRRPSASTLRNVQRGALLSEPLRGGANAAEDALAMAAGLLNATEQLQELLSDAFREVETIRNDAAAAAAAAPSSSPQRGAGMARFPELTAGNKIGSGHDSGGGDAALQREVLSLRKELDLTRQNYEAKLQLASQERQLLELQHEGHDQVVSRLESENKTLRLKTEAMDMRGGLLEQTARERQALQARCDELEALVARNAQDKLEVAQRFETLQRFIQQQQQQQQNGSGGNGGGGAAGEPQQLEALMAENRALRAQLRGGGSGGDGGAAQAEEVAALREEVASLQRRLTQSQRTGREGATAAADELQRELHRLRKARSTGPDGLAHATGIGGAEDPWEYEGAGAGAGAGASSSAAAAAAARYKSKLRVFEMTVAALNAELSVVEEKLVAMERAAVDDRRRLLDEMESERHQHREEQAECDAVVQRVTTELEGMMRENAQLKARLREYHRQLTSGE